MTDEQILLAMARLGGYSEYLEVTPEAHAVYFITKNSDYLTSHDAMHRVRRSLTDDELKRVGHELEQMCGNTLHPWVLLSLATCGDWCEAILKAKGLWELK